VAKSESNVEPIPFKKPGDKCNARMQRGGGYCMNGAGEGTDHPGFGRCRLHGGASPREEGVDGPADLFRVAGLDNIINLAETMTHDDQEYLMEVGTNALVVIRATIVAEMHKGGTTPKELNDLSMALQRVDKLLSDHPNEVAPGAALVNEDDGEMAALLDIEKAIKARG
jgi:hypothetical protein